MCNIIAKLAILAAIIAAFVVISFAHLTTITTVDVDGDVDNPQRWHKGGGCREQLQRAQELSRCEQFIRDQAQQEGRKRIFSIFPWWRHRGSSNSGEEEFVKWRHFQPCCQELIQVKKGQCRCEGIREIVRRQRQQLEQLGGEKIQEVVEIASYLPSMCGVGPQKCDEIKAV